MPQKSPTPPHIRRIAYALVTMTGRKGDTLPERKAQVAAETGTSLRNIEQILKGKASTKKAEEFLIGSKNTDFWGKERAAAIAYLAKNQNTGYARLQANLKKSGEGQGVDWYRYKWMSEYFEAADPKRKTRRGIGRGKKKLARIYDKKKYPEWFNDLEEMFDDDLWFVS